MNNSDGNRIGPLKSKEDITISIQTYAAKSLWDGRARSEEKHSILGLNGFATRVNKIEIAIRQDDPYADYHYHKIENAIEDELITLLKYEQKIIDKFFEENVPETMRITRAISQDPLIIPIRFANTLAFKMTFRLLELDNIIASVHSAGHIGILDQISKVTTIERLKTAYRSVLYKVSEFRYTGVTRDDMAANNQKARLAKEEMGELPLEYLEGSVRSSSAPPLPMKRLKSLGVNVDPRKNLTEEISKNEPEAMVGEDSEILEKRPAVD